MARGANALELLQREHKHVQGLFRRFQRSRDEAERGRILQEACAALIEHADLEERVFYPIVRGATGYDELVEEAAVEHTAVRRLVDELRHTRDRVRQHALFTVLGEYTSHHIREEEDRIFPMVAKTGMDLEALGLELTAARSGEGGKNDAAVRRAEPKQRSPGGTSHGPAGAHDEAIPGREEEEG